MAIQFQQDSEDTEISTINTPPLVDVMLVLLIIFLITIPVATSSVAVQLPKQRVEIREVSPNDVVISVDQNGHIYWHDHPLQNAAELSGRLREAAARQPQPTIHVRGDQRARYDGIGRILYACQVAGIAKVSFITEPPAAGG